MALTRNEQNNMAVELRKAADTIERLCATLRAERAEHEAEKCALEAEILAMREDLEKAYAAWRDLEKLSLVATATDGVRIEAFTAAELRHARTAFNK